MSSNPHRPGRRRALVAGTVAGLAVASLAGSLVTGASASPPTPPSVTAPTPSMAAPAAVPSGLRARTMDGAERAVARSTSPLAQRLRGGAVASPTGSVSTQASAAAVIKPPAFTAIGATGIVASAAEGLAFAPDGSRVAWVSGSRIYSAHPGGAGAFVVAASAGAKRISWSPRGTFLALETPRRTTLKVVTAALSQTVETPEYPDNITALSWLNESRVIALDPAFDRFVVTPVISGGSKVYEPGSRRVLDAVASPDGTRVAVRALQLGAPPGPESLVIVDAVTLKDVAVVVTTAGQLGRPAWSADSSTVYVPRTEGGTTSVVSHSASTAEGEPVVVLADAGATPHIYLRPKPAFPGYGKRFTGKDAVATSVSVSKDSFGTTRGTSCSQAGAAVSAVLAKAGSVEATVAAPLAARTCGPLLLTGSRTLDSRTAAELKRLLSRGRTVRLVGNTTSLSPAVATAVSRLGFKTVRYSGRDVYATAVQVALKGFKDHSVAALASATQPMAAVAAAATAGAADVPLLLTAGTRMPAVTAAYLKKYRTGAWVVGSQGAKAATWAYRYSGANDVATSLDVASRFYYPPAYVTLVAPNAVADAYAGAGFAALYGSAVLVVGPKAMVSTVRTYIDRTSASVQGAILFGPTKAVVNNVLTDAVKLSGGQTLQ